MDGLYQLGLAWTASLQSLPWLEAPMRFFTFLGTSEFFIFVLPGLYWCIDSRLGIRVAFILLIGTGFNEILKLALHGPRPYWISASLKALSAEATFGVPSGHSQTAAGLWGMMAATLRRRWATMAALILIALIGLSRVYLGVHFPQDVLLGWLVGGLTLWAFVKLWAPIEAWVKGRSLGQQVLLSLIAPALMLLTAAGLVKSLDSYEMPAQWMLNAARAGEPLPAPTSPDSTITAAGALFGFSLGLALMQRQGGFAPAGPDGKRIFSLIVGLLGITLLYIGLKAVMPDGDSLAGWSSRFVRYSVLGFWVSAGAPWIFRKLRLGPKPPGSQADRAVQR